MLFDFPAFIEELRQKEDKKEIVEKYEKHFWKIQWDIRDQIWYTDYLSQFPTQSYITPEDLEDDFDWDILQKLVIGSFSSDYELKQDDNGWELYIAVKSGDQSIVKTVSELWSFQILRLYEIYIEEQMKLFILAAEEMENAEKDGDDDEETMNLLQNYLNNHKNITEFYLNGRMIKGNKN